MAVWQARTAWLSLALSLLFVAINIDRLQLGPGNQTVWLAILAVGFLFVAAAALLIVKIRRR